LIQRDKKLVYRKDQYRPLTTRLLSGFSFLFSLKTNLPVAEYGIPMTMTFGKERLDALDRKLLEIICDHGREGQSFNKLVEEVKSSSASRSTFAFRAKRLERLGYLESFCDPQNKQLKRIRGRPLMLMITRLVSKIRNQCQDLDIVLTSSKATDNSSTEEGFARTKQILQDASQKMKGIFSLVPTYALYLGEAAAADLVLPMVMEDFKRLNSNLASLLSSDSRLRDALLQEKIELTAVDSLKDDFKYAFGTEMGTALPRFSKHMQRLSEKGPNK
jgi:hypothetical protein